MNDVAAQSIALSLGLSALVSVACRRVRIPALLPLLFVGLALGSSGLGVIDATSLGPALKGFITVAIGLLIFEGALHLNKLELARAPLAVWGLLTIGAVVTWAGSAVFAHFLLGMGWPIAVLLGACLIVTGPTVVQPILRLLHVSPRVHTVLAAEAVLIDPLGVIATITALEVLRLYFVSGPELHLAGEGMWFFARPFLGGAVVGAVMGTVGYALLKRFGRAGRVEPQLLNLTSVGICMTCVGIGEAITPEGGLVAVTICGVVMARTRVVGATELRAFKELLAVMLVGTLFLLLASRFHVARLGAVSWREVLFVLALLFAVRPVAVALSTWGSRLTTRERIFAGTFAPRGIVALSVATVASAELGQALAPAGVSGLASEAQRLEQVMFVVIAGTVLFGSTFSPLLARLLGLRTGAGTAVILVGGHSLSVAFARWLGRRGIDCRIIDNNEARVLAAVAEAVDAVVGDATDARWMDDVGSPHGAGWMIAWTGNHDVDQLAVRWAEERLGTNRAAMWSSKPARGALEPNDISAGEAIQTWLDRYGDGLVALRETTDAAQLDRVLGCVCDGRFTSGTAALCRAAAPEVWFVGLSARRGSPEPDAPSRVERTSRRRP